MKTVPLLEGIIAIANFGGATTSGSLIPCRAASSWASEEEDIVRPPGSQRVLQEVQEPSSRGLGGQLRMYPGGGWI